MTKEIKFQFDYGEKVMMLYINQTGIIEQLLFDGAACKYQVSYWFSGDRKTAWVFACELQRMNQ